MEESITGVEESIAGVVEHIIFRNGENGYTVFTMRCGADEETCVGFFAELSEGAAIRAFGRHTEHISYGVQFKVDRYEYHVPEDVESIEAYLGSGAVKGIGKTLAARIVKLFKEDAIRILEEEPERLAEVKGISLRKAREIGENAAAQSGMRKAMMFLEGYGISLPMRVKIYKEYGEDIYSVLKENPYRLAEDIKGVGFLTADRIAREAGIPMDSEFRVRSGILYALGSATGEGSVYLPEEILIKRASSLLNVDHEAVGYALDGLLMDRKLVARNTEEGRAVYTGSLYYMELNSARMLLDLNVDFGEDMAAVGKRVQEMSGAHGVKLEEEQMRAVTLSSGHGVVILTGGPGTGKTTTINEMIRYFKSRRLKVQLAAPTGRAAKRMTETTGYEASTIHRLLEISTVGDDELSEVRFARCAENPLTTDVVIIDEMSMVDIALFHSLLCAIPRGTRLVLVGDVDQLPSVGPGAVLRDILRADVFPKVRLTRIFRQAAYSDIIVNAHRINKGEQITLGTDSREFFFLRRDDPNLLISNVIELVRDKLPSYVHAKPFDIQVLTPMRKGNMGVLRLNQILQNYLNPPSPKKREKAVGERLFRVGDKVMQTKNNYQIEWEIRGKYGIPVDSGCGIFNGDMGVVRAIDDMSHLMTVEFDEGRYVEYPFLELEDLELAYAVTIHKSQGSEYPAVIIPLLTGPRMLLTRNLLYTAVTRARSCVVLLGNEAAFRGMIDNIPDDRRFSSLDLRILELCGQDNSETT